MSHMNGGTLFLVVSLFILGYLAFFLKLRLPRITFRGDTPMRKAQRAWRKAKPDSEAQKNAEREWDNLIIEKMKKASTLCELYNVYEEGLTYTHFGFQKKRNVTAAICSGYSERYGKIKQEMEQDEIEKANRRLKYGKGDKAPRLKKIEHKNKVPDGNVCYMSLFKDRASK